MSNSYRLFWVVMLSALVSLVAEAQFATAQRLVIGGGNQSNQSNQNNNDRDEDDQDRDRDRDEDEGEQNSNKSGKKSSRSGNRTNDEVQQFFDRKQGVQNSQQQGNSNQFRRGNQQGQFQGQQFQDGQFQQFPQFRPQENQQDLRFGTWRGNQWQGSRDVEKWARVFGGGKRPFSSDWYNEHPKAWRHDHDHDDIFVVATLPGVYSWLGWGNVPQQPGVRIGAEPDLSQFHDWYPLGVYSLMSGPGDMGTRVVQLAIDRHGHIAGNYYDLITDTNSSVSGEVRQQSQRVYWSVNKNDAIRFRASLNRLLQPYGMMTVQLPGGEQDWQFVRLEN